MEEQTHKLPHVLPCGEDLRVFLTQESVTATMLRRLLRRRGVFLATTDKKDMLEHIMLSFLSPGEFSNLLEETKTREDSPKMRGRTYQLRQPNLTLADILPQYLDIHSITKDEFGNSRTLGTPEFVDDPVAGKDSFVLRYKTERTSYTADWMSARRVFDAEIRYTYDSSRGTLEVTTQHTSRETERSNKNILSAIRRHLNDQNLLTPDDEIMVTFGSFTNEQRIAFLMKFTGLKVPVSYSFEKLTDMALKLDPEVDVPSQDRLDWMKESVRRVFLNGDKLENTFFLKDMTCRPYIIVWRIEGRYSFETADYTGYFDAVFDFSDYSLNNLASAEFQIAIPKLAINGKGSRCSESANLKHKFSHKLNSEKSKFFRESTGA